MRRGVSNLFSNLRTPLTILNQVLQGKGRAALSDTGRFLLNSTAGVGGLFDPATRLGLEEHREDFGQTLAVWGVPDGPFVMVPLLGPRNLRDTITTPLDLVANPLFHYENTSIRDKLWSLDAVNVRARLLSGEALIEDSADPYITIRDAYRQNRLYLIFDGDPPNNDDDLFDDFLDQDKPTANDSGNQNE
jgi:phospholipid-binding lipoprotein MlaA